MQQKHNANPSQRNSDLAQAARNLEVFAPRGLLTFQVFSDREKLKRTHVTADGEQHRSAAYAKVLHGAVAKLTAPLAQLRGQSAAVLVMVSTGDSRRVLIDEQAFFAWVDRQGAQKCL